MASSSLPEQQITPIAAVLFDWDGTTGVPWSHVEIPFPQVRSLFQHLSINNIHQGLVSFNPHAFCALKSHDLHTYLTAFRAGCNQAWNHDDITQYHDTMRKGLSKSAQMHDILAHEWKHLDLKPEQVLLIDDDMKNIDDARQAGFQVLFVQDSWLGVHWPVLKSLATFPRITDPNPSILRHLHSNDHDVSILKLGLLTDFASKIQKHSPQRMNELLEFAGRLSKHLGVGYAAMVMAPGVQSVSRYSVDLGYHSIGAIAEYGWVSTVARYQHKGDELLNADNIVIARSKAVVHISKPRSLSKVIIARQSPIHFTRADLAEQVAEFYVHSARMLDEDNTHPLATSKGMLVAIDVELGPDIAEVYSTLDF